MKNIFIIGLFLLAGLFSVNAQNSFAISSEAISQQQNKNNYVVLTRKIPQLKPILLAAEEIKKEWALTSTNVLMHAALEAAQ